MNLDLTQEQAALVERLRAVLADCEPQQARGAYDAELMARLQQEGFLQQQQDARHAGLEAALVIEEVSRANRMVPIGAQAMIAAPLFEGRLRDPVALCREGAGVPVRFASHAPVLIVVGDERACAYRVNPDRARQAKSNYVYPLAYPPVVSGEPLAIWPAQLVRRRWQLALSAEIVGAMDGALQRLVAHLSSREQFGKALGSFQAIQHRVAELSVSIECARYLVRDAAWHDADELAAAAATYAATTAHTVCLEAHQLSGARGFTLEFGLYRWTLRLQMLSLEAGGAAEHAKFAADRRWGIPDRSPLEERAGIAS